MDTTAVGIVLGLGSSAAYIALRVWRGRKFSPGGVFVVSAAGFSIPAGAQLIIAGLSGNPEALPNNWREYVAAAGVVAIGLSLQYLVNVFRSVLRKPVAGTPTDADSEQRDSTSERNSSAS